MKYILLLTMILLSLSGSQDSIEEQAQQSREKPLTEPKALKEVKKSEQNDTKLSKIGITMDKDKIIIDTNKTKEFFQDITNKIGKKIKKISQELQEYTLKYKEMGVDLNKSHIHIDLNRTKDFIDDWDKRMQEVVKEFETIAKEIEDNDKN
jgi:hypothetical protein